MNGLIVDLFAGGGGASLGIEMGLDRQVNIAVNHDPEAMAMHRANHPWTQHYVCDIHDVDPVQACGGQPVDLLWASPDCTHHSKAKGGKPRDKKLRFLAWTVVEWAKAVRPAVICLENVEEFRQWGPLDEAGQPIKAQRGIIFDGFVKALRTLGYSVDWRQLKACDYGTPTTRKRLFLIARADGSPARWPKPTHGIGLLPYRTAAECIDWSIPCPSIFTRKRPLADATCRRIAKGIVRYVLENPKPFIITYYGEKSDEFRGISIDDLIRTQTTENRHALVMPFITEHANASNPRCMAADEPLRTQCAAVKGGHFALVAPHITKFNTGSVGIDCREPMHTITAGGRAPEHPGGCAPLGVVSAFLAKHYGGVVGQATDLPIGAVTAIDHHSLVAASLVRQFGNSSGADVSKPMGAVMPGGSGKTQLAAACLSRYNGQSVGQVMNEPVGTVDSTERYAQVVAFLTKYYGTNIGINLGEPMQTVTSKDRFGLVTVNIEGEPYVLTDIGLRMLQPRELFRAQGFPDNYIIDAENGGRLLTKTAQVRMVGNSVCPQVAAAIVAVNVG